MRRLKSYVYNLTSNNDVSISAGNTTLMLSFRWPSVVQEQYDSLAQQVRDLARSDPIIRDRSTNQMSYDRDYDWVEYYSNIPAYGDGMEEWWEQQEDVPQSLVQLTSAGVINVLVERRTLATEMKGYLQDLKDMLVYSCSITVDDQVFVTSVRTGAYCNWRSSSFSLRFVSDLDTIGIDDLDKVTVEILEYEFI